MNSNPTTYNIKTFPLPATDLNAEEKKLAGANTTATANYVGVCFSGGGSRSLSCTLGQLRGLRYLGLLDRTFFISSVSGGSWASTLFTYLPEAISDNDFLGTVVPNPGDLWWIPLDHKPEPSNLDYLPPNNLGTVPTRLNILEDIGDLIKLKRKYKYENNELWVRFVGNTVFQPFGLEEVNNNPQSPEYGQPTKFFSYSKQYVKQAITANNPELGPSDFYVLNRNRPFLIVNWSMFQQPGDKSSPLLPVESTAVGAGVRQAIPGATPQDSDIGGGVIQPFGFSSTNQQATPDPTTAKATVAQRFSLADISGLSSAAFAETIEAKHPEFDGLIPKYNYWPVLNFSEAKNQSKPYTFADGGNLENTGIMPLLARNLPTIICCVNCETEIEQRGSNNVIVVDAQLPPLFGYAPIGNGDQYIKYKDGGCDPSAAPYQQNQVFTYDAFQTLLNGLWTAKQNQGPVMFLQPLEVQPNSKFNIAGNYSAQVLWVYNDRCQVWWNSLSSLLRDGLELDFLQFGNFPHYGTITQLQLSAVQVNLLAHMTTWNFTQDEHVVQDGKTSKALLESLFSGAAAPTGVQ
jgi:hypothetical protein